MKIFSLFTTFFFVVVLSVFVVMTGCITEPPADSGDGGDSGQALPVCSEDGVHTVFLRNLANEDKTIVVRDECYFVLSASDGEVGLSITPDDSQRRDFLLYDYLDPIETINPPMSSALAYFTAYIEEGKTLYWPISSTINGELGLVEWYYQSIEPLSQVDIISNNDILVSLDSGMTRRVPLPFGEYPYQMDYYVDYMDDTEGPIFEGSIASFTADDGEEYPLSFIVNGNHVSTPKFIQVTDYFNGEVGLTTLIVNNTAPYNVRIKIKSQENGYHEKTLIEHAMLNVPAGASSDAMSLVESGATQPYVLNSGEWEIYIENSLTGEPVSGYNPIELSLLPEQSLQIDVTITPSDMTVNSVTPSGTDVTLEDAQNILVTFSTDIMQMDAAVYENGSLIYSISSFDGNVATISFANALPDTTYELQIEMARNTNGSYMASTYSHSFTTASYGVKATGLPPRYTNENSFFEISPEVTIDSQTRGFTEITYSLNDDEWVDLPLGNTFDLIGLPEGSHTLTFKAKIGELLIDSTEFSYKFDVDMTAPTPAGVVRIGPNSSKWGVSADEDAETMVAVRYEKGEANPEDLLDNTSYSVGQGIGDTGVVVYSDDVLSQFSDNSLPSNLEVFYVVFLYDRAGNVSSGVPTQNIKILPVITDIFLDMSKSSVVNDELFQGNIYIIDQTGNVMTSFYGTVSLSCSNTNISLLDEDSNIISSVYFDGSGMKNFNACLHGVDKYEEITTIKASYGQLTTQTHEITVFGLSELSPSLPATIPESPSTVGLTIIALTSDGHQTPISGSVFISNPDGLSSPNVTEVIFNCEKSKTVQIFFDKHTHGQESFLTVEFDGISNNTDTYIIQNVNPPANLTDFTKHRTIATEYQLDLTLPLDEDADINNVVLLRREVQSASGLESKPVDGITYPIHSLINEWMVIGYTTSAQFFDDTVLDSVEYDYKAHVVDTSLLYSSGKMASTL